MNSTTTALHVSLLAIACPLMMPGHEVSHSAKAVRADRHVSARTGLAASNASRYIRTGVAADASRCNCVILE